MIVKRIAPIKPIINHLHTTTFIHEAPTLLTHHNLPNPLPPFHLPTRITYFEFAPSSTSNKTPQTQDSTPSSMLASHNLTKTTTSPTSSSSQVCNKFPYSWQPIYRFFQYTEVNTTSHFTHTSVSFNKLLDVIGKSRNIELFWELLHEMGQRHPVNDKTFRIALNTLAAARELKKCVEFFHSMNACGY